MTRHSMRLRTATNPGDRAGGGFGQPGGAVRAVAYPLRRSGVSSPVPVSTPSQATIPAAGQPMASTAGPTVYSVAKPVIGENAEGPTAPAPAARSYVPATGVSAGTGWSTMPRSSWISASFRRIPTSALSQLDFRVN